MTGEESSWSQAGVLGREKRIYRENTSVNQIVCVCVLEGLAKVKFHRSCGQLGFFVFLDGTLC